MKSSFSRMPPKPGASNQLRSAILAFLSTLLALPAAAVDLPNEPLQSSGRVAPNILFILDDSGSMAGNAMPDAVPATTTMDIRYQAYTRNTIYYNPANTYRPWVNANGSLMTGGTDYSNVYTDDNFLTGSADLSGGTQTFYVPKNLAATAAQLADAANYYRSQIFPDGRIVRSELLRNVNGSEGVNNRNCENQSSGWRWKNCTYALPSARSEAEERANFAIWYSYHRTRMKVAKASAGQAFNDLGANVRVGFRTIWRRTKSGNPVTQAMPILIGRNDGLFDDPNGTTGANNNKTLWYDRLYGASGSGATPLHGALADAGIYYGNSTATGPYGPQTGASQFACRQNFTILTTDGYWNGKDNYTDVAGEQDNVDGQTITSPTGDSYRYTPTRPYLGTASDSLADVAMRYWKSDLRTDLKNVVPTSSKDPAFWQHMTTYAISIGAAGTLNPETDLPAITSGALNWPAPANNTITNIDDLWHASVNGRGEFIVASNPDEFTQGLKAALASIIERIGSFSNLSANSTRIDSSTLAFQASFVSGVWTGQLRAYPITSAGVSGTPSWSASSGIPTTGRKIFTFNGTAGATFPTAVQTTLLARTSAPAVTGADNAAYIAGARDREISNGGTLRNRTTLLGDIVDSSPAYDAQTATVYVGANDGMMHAFDASSGAELFAYVPGSINFSDLSTLSRPDYEHRYFVDGPLVLSRRDQTPNSSILVGTLGRGGNGLFALDVTSPGTFSASKVKWERTTTPANNMGKILGQPIIAKLNNGDMGLIVPNGVNSANNRAALLIYRLSDGTLLSEIDTGVGSATAPNGLSAPTVRDVDGNGTIDYAYAGDMLGNLWKFNLTSASRTTWANASNRLRLFSAVNASGQAQPITSAPVVARDPSTFQLWVFFGTGRFMTTADAADTQVQTLYGLKDGTATIGARDTALQQRKIVTIDTLSGETVRAFEPTSALLTTKSGWYIDLVNPPTALVPQSTPVGERIVSDPQVVSSVLIVSSIVPSSDPCLPGGSGYLNALDAFTGSSLDTSYFDLDGDGTFTDETVLVNGVQVPVGSVALNGMGTMGNVLSGGSGGGSGQICVNLSNGTVECQRIREARRTSRVSWRELLKE